MRAFELKNGLNEQMFPLPKLFVAPLLALPHSSATAERTFSDLNLIKSKIRNKLHTATIDSIMTAKEMLNQTTADQFIPFNELLKQYHKYSSNNR